MKTCKVVLFISRNKDNKTVKGFKERRMNFLWDADDLPMDEFDDFVSKGVVGERSRFYISVNARDVEKTKKMLLVKLITDPDVDLTKLQSLVAGLAAKPENKAESKWLFDFDSSDKEEQANFLCDLNSAMQKEKEAGHIPSDAKVRNHKTLHGMAYVVTHGFDCRKLLEKWQDKVSLKRDDMLYITSQTKPDSLLMKRIPLYTMRG